MLKLTFVKLEYIGNQRLSKKRIFFKEAVFYRYNIVIMSYFHFFKKRDNLFHFITLMNTSIMSYTENQLKNMLLSHQETERDKALQFIYLNKEWRTIGRNVWIRCPEEFIEASYKIITKELKESIEQEPTKLQKKELKDFYRGLCTKHFDDALVDMFKQGGEARTEAIEICNERFYAKIFNILKK